MLNFTQNYFVTHFASAIKYLIGMDSSMDALNICSSHVCREDFDGIRRLIWNGSFISIEIGKLDPKCLMSPWTTGGCTQVCTF